MAIPYRVDSLEKVPEAFRELYVEKNEGGKISFIAGVEGVSPKEVVDDFRTNNISLREQVEHLSESTKRWTELGEEPDVVKAELLQLRELKEKVNNKELVAAEGFKTALESKTQAMKDELSGKVSAMEKRALEAEARAKQAEENLKQFRLDTEIQAASIDVGVKAKAMVDVRGRAVLAGWTLNEQGQPVLRNKATGLVEHGSDGYPLTLREWMRGPLYEEAEHIFEKGTGGGAPGSSNNSANGSQKYPYNPWAKETRNITLQSKITSEDPMLAEQFKKQAGVRGYF